MRARHSIGAQAAEVRRQLAMMRGVYPKMAEAGVITREAIDCDLAIMESVVRTFDWLERNQKRIKAAFAREDVPYADQS